MQSHTASLYVGLAVLRWFAGLLGVCTLLAPVRAEPVPEDDFDFRSYLDSGVPLQGNNVGATVQSGEPVPSGYSAGNYQGTLWYQWTPQATAWHEVSTIGSGVDTLLAVWVTSDPFNPTLGSLNLVHVSNNADGTQASQVQFLAEDTKVYLIAVASPSGASRGEFVINAQSIPNPFSTLTALTFNPMPANVTAAPVWVTATMTLNSTSEIAAGQFRLYDPNNTLYASLPFSSSNRTAGTVASGTYAVSLTLPRYLQPGAWRWSLHLQNAVAILPATKIAGYGWEERSPTPSLQASLSVSNSGLVDAYQQWTSLQGIPASAAPYAASFGDDGVSNLAKFAFGMDIRRLTPATLVTNGAALVQPGLPRGTHDGQRLSITYVRRKNFAAEGLTYRVKFSDNLVDWADAQLGPQVIASSTEHEAVTVMDVLPVGPQPRRFAKVEVDFVLP